MPFCRATTFLKQYESKTNQIESILSHNRLNSFLLSIHFGHIKDINLRLQKHSNQNQRYLIQNDCQWKLHQVNQSSNLNFQCNYNSILIFLKKKIQDASNHLISALSILQSPPLRYVEKENKVDFKTADEVIQVSRIDHLIISQLNLMIFSFRCTQIINNIMACLLKARNSLITPKKRTLNDIQNSRNNVTNLFLCCRYRTIFFCN
jgi:hypothetical protein